MANFVELTTGRYRATTYDHFYSLNLNQRSSVLIDVTHDNGTSSIYDSKMNYVARTTNDKPLFLEAGTYIVHAKYSSPTFGVTNVYIPSQPSFESLPALATGSFQQSSFDDFYALNIKTGGTFFIVPSNGSAVFYDRYLNFIKYADSKPIYLDAGNYIVHASYYGSRYGALNVNIPDAHLTSDRSIDQPPLLSRNDSFKGSDFADFVQGLTGNDSFIGNNSSSNNPDAFFGGEGTDVSIYRGKMSEYKLQASNTLQDHRKPEGILISGRVVTDTISGRDGIDYLHDVERLQFADKSLAFDIDGVAGQAYRLYQAAFDRKPDLAGLGTWIDLMDKGLSLAEVSSYFQRSDEFKTLYGSDVTNEEFVDLLYKNVLDRLPDAGGYATWKGVLDAGTWTRERVLIGFGESAENQAKVIGSIQNGIEFQLVA